MKATALKHGRSSAITIMLCVADTTVRVLCIVYTGRSLYTMCTQIRNDITNVRYETIIPNVKTPLHSPCLIRETRNLNLFTMQFFCFCPICLIVSHFKNKHVYKSKLKILTGSCQFDSCKFPLLKNSLG